MPQVWTTDSSGLSLVKGEGIAEGTNTVRIELLDGTTHLIPTPPFALEYRIEDGVLGIYSDESPLPIRQYGAWAWVDQIAYLKPRSGQGRVARIR